MIKVVSFTICPFVQRITALLEAKNVPYQIEFISLKNKPQWFLDISPNGQVPVLVTDNNTALFESDAIAEYLDDAYPAIENDVLAEQKALDRAWSYQAAKHYLVQCSTMRSTDETTLNEREAKLAKAFIKAEANVVHPFWKGEHLSNVDMAWLPLLHRAAIIEQHSGHDFLASFPKVKAWQQALAKTGLFEQSVTTDFEEKFVSFYLSEETYLGRGCDPLQQGCAPSDSCQTGTCC
ncbi:glutathione S-transferase family protein [Thalassotalea sp. M1531]|uniref:Glutathione S-transferase family protein n=1 Tax=Thalassotalea algicola TaxID=2716224 RepID=A0A7Y0Q6H0_9GAMM|nr:glutathione S-transferase family protein [Thalassotalea algicola]NMP32014.1 glutathione S-transferase family protein [Thalassotalea algicola]